MTLEDARNKVLLFGLNPMFDEYLGNKNLYLCSSNLGYLYTIRIDNNSYQRKFLEFSKNNPHSIHNMKLWCKIENKNFILSDDNTEFLSAHFKYKWICIQHGEFLASWNNIKNNRGCPLCGNIIISQKLKNIERHNIRGKKHHNWAGGISNISDFLRVVINPWKIDSFAHYNGTCFISKEKLKLEIHHLKNFKDIVLETFEESKIDIRTQIKDYTDEELKILSEICLRKHYEYGLGVCITKKIHQEFHKFYGIVNNTQAQWSEFYNTKVMAGDS